MPCDIAKPSSDIENVDWSTGTGAGAHYTTVVRFGSSSSQASQSSGDICRICHCESDPQNPLLTPCYCSGSLKYVHQACLQQWLTASETNSCELCKFPFIMHTKIKPFNEWRSLDISGVERRRLCCSVLFHCAAALCVIWSLCVLIERAADDVQRGLIDWPFWTKLAVVTVGLTGGVVFMYIQCRAYLHLCHRWKARNRILLIQNAPEKVHPLSPPSPVTNHSRNIPRSNANAASLAAAANATNAVNNYNFNAYNYAAASAAGSVAGRGANLIDVGACGPIDNQPASPSSRCMLNEGASVNSAGGQHLNAPQHGQIIANIENNSHNYDRDWTLDDVSQISSFRPCPQGSGSMTPFHDSIHNVLEHSINSGDSNSVNSSRQDLSTNPHHAPANVCSVSEKSRVSDLTPLAYNSATKTITPPPSARFGGCSAVGRGAYRAAMQQYSNPSVFLGNRGILNDPDYPKINYRHSSVLMSPDITDNLDKFLGKDLRRYSDTKLLASDTDILNPMIFNVPLHTSIKTRPDHDNEFSKKQQHRQKQQSYKNSLAGEALAQTILDIAGQKNSFNSSATGHYVDPQQLEFPNEYLFNIDRGNRNDFGQAKPGNVRHNSCTYDLEPSNHKTLRRSLNTVEVSGECNNKINRETQASQIDKGRLFFKSLPNLSSSCESLIKK